MTETKKLNKQINEKHVSLSQPKRLTSATHNLVSSVEQIHICNM